MSEMTGRERLLKTFRRERPDRVAIGPFLWINNVYEMFDYQPTIDTFLDPPDFDPYVKFVEYCDYFGFDVMHTLAYPWNSWDADRPGENWDVKVNWEGEGDERKKIVDVRTPGGSLRHTQNWRRLSKYLVVWATEEYLLKTQQDFELFAKYGPQGDYVDVKPIQRAAAAVGDKGLVDAPSHGVFNTMSLFRNLEVVLTDPYTDEGLYRAMMEYFTTYVKKQARALIEAGADIFEIGGNLATSGVGPKFFKNFVLDYEKQVVDEVRNLGAYSIYHNCGDAAKVMKFYNDINPDCWGYVTPPPFADVDLDEALSVIRPDMVLRGNVDQVEFLVKASIPEIRERVQNLMEKVKPRGNWILSTSDFFLDGCPYENIKAFADAGKEFGCY